MDLDGSVVAVLGPNGAGKTTLLSLVTGARQPTTGSISVVGHDLADSGGRRALQARLGFVPQSLDPFPGYTVEELLRYVGWLRRVPSAELPEAITRRLGAADLLELRLRKIRTLSGGMRQRVALAQALTNQPSLVVLDEPTVGLDPEQRARFVELVRCLAVGSRVLLATHLVEDAAALCDHVLILDAGRVAFVGSIRELVRRGGEKTISGPSVQAGYHAVLISARESAGV